jgi:hypothetical protein
MSTGKNLTNVHVEGCVPTPLRRTLDQLKRNAEILLPLTSGVSSPDLNINIENLFADDNSEWPESVVASVGGPGYAGTLNADLPRDAGVATVTMTTVDGRVIPVSGYFVKTDYKISSGKRVFATMGKNKVWYVITTDDCLVPA